MIKTNYIQAFCVAGYDGYYIYDHRNAESGGYTLVKHHLEESHWYSFYREYILQ